MKKLNCTLSLLLLFFISFAQTSSEILVLSAIVKDKPIEKAEVIFQKNGQNSISMFTNAAGKTTIPTQYRNDENVIVIIKKPGYSTLVTKCMCDGLTYAISPAMKELDGVRVVLSWGAEPLDIDGHLSYDGGYICYYSKDGAEANLDVDDVNSYGPETITITTKKQGKKYVYAVHDYSDREQINTTKLSESRAKVFIYIGNTLIKTYQVPEGKKGNVWIPFIIDEMGNIENVGDFKNATTWEGVQTILRNYRYEGNNMENNSNKTESDIVNKKGEEEFHAGNFESAIFLYQSAIELDNGNGQAYSNLGLAFQKSNKEAEALWANRKAIDLASGDMAYKIKASSYYNIAKIYEDKAQWQNALNNYKLANQNRDHKIYKDGIARMMSKLR